MLKWEDGLTFRRTKLPADDLGQLGGWVTKRSVCGQGCGGVEVVTTRSEVSNSSRGVNVVSGGSSSLTEPSLNTRSGV